MEEKDGSGMAAETCSGDLTRSSCILEPAYFGEFDAIAAVRMVISCLSVLGAMSIIVSVIAKRQVWSSKVHPIFVLSVADLMLALMWVTGGIVWLRRAPDRSWCFAISLLTIILVCITINLTLVYAVFAHASLKNTNFNTILVTLERTTVDHFWSTARTVIIYCIAWLLPIVLVLVVFGAIAGGTGMVSVADDCSCWCLPVFGNVLPMALPKDNATLDYVSDVRILILSYGVIVGLHYMIVFVSLVVIYQRILSYIKNMQISIRQSRESSNYGATQALLAKGQSKARKRVVYFLVVFIVNGFFNLLLSITVTINESINIHNGPMGYHTHSSGRYNFVLWLHVLQSVTIPVQGLLNAIVYGWTRDDFLYVMSISNTQPPDESSYEISQSNKELEDSGSHSSKREHSFTHRLPVHTDDEYEDD